MSALTPEQLDKLASKVGDHLDDLTATFMDALTEGGHFRQGPSGTKGNCSQCGSRWPCYPAEQTGKLLRTANKALEALGVDPDVAGSYGASHVPPSAASEVAALREKYGEEAVREAVGTAGTTEP